MVQEVPFLTKEAIRSILMNRQRRSLSLEGKRRAAVLIPLYEEGKEFRILLTKRAESVKIHQGQIAFPGGTWQSEDPDIMATALREAHEEVGIRPEDVEVLGQLDDTFTATSNFLITPTVGVIPYPYPFQMNPEEIAHVFSLSLSVLRDPQAFQEETWEREGRRVQVFARREGPHVIWGATARILRHMGESLFSA